MDLIAVCVIIALRFLWLPMIRQYMHKVLAVYNEFRYTALDAKYWRNTANGKIKTRDIS